MKKERFFKVSAHLLDHWRTLVQAPTLLGYHLIHEGTLEQWPSDRTPRSFLHKNRYSVPIPIEPRDPDDPLNDPVKIIRLRALRHDTKHEIHCQIGINISACALDPKTTSWWLLRPPPADGLAWKLARGSIWLLSLSLERSYRLLEEKAGMSRHSWMIMEALKDQLDDVTRSQLRRALRNDWFCKPDTSSHPK